MSKANRANKVSEKMGQVNLELDEIRKFKLDEINKIKNYFSSEIQE